MYEHSVSDSHNPLIEVGPIKAWPESPIRERLSALAEGALNDDKPTALRVQTFIEGGDHAVLAIPAACHSTIVEELMHASPRFHRMVESSFASPTVSAQLWSDAPPLEAFGVTTGPVGTVRTWAEMGEVIAAEGWQRAPKSLAYLCNVDPADLWDVTDPHDELER